MGRRLSLDRFSERGLEDTGRVIEQLRPLARPLATDRDLDDLVERAGDEWGAPMRVMPVPPGREGSYEDVLHRMGGGDKVLRVGDAPATPELLAPRGHRAIGVVYRPEFEHLGNYVPTVLPRRYDALLYVEKSRALDPLHLMERHDGEAPATYPSGM